MKRIIAILFLLVMPLIASGQQRILSIKTNAPYWFALLPNAEVEAYLGNQLSINTEFQFAWWSSAQNGFYYQLFSASPELRYRFCKQSRFDGHYIGIYGSGGLYDIMLKSDRNGFQGDFWSVGVSYGYSKPIGKNLSLEFGLGVGYLQSKYSRYVRCTHCYQRKSREVIRWLGPTKIKIALVWNIGKKGALL